MIILSYEGKQAFMWAKTVRYYLHNFARKGAGERLERLLEANPPTQARNLALYMYAWAGRVGGEIWTDDSGTVHIWSYKRKLNAVLAWGC